MADIRHAGIDKDQVATFPQPLKWRSAKWSRPSGQVGGWTKVQRLIRNILLFLAGE
jgi:hypothetical protein